MFQISRTLSRIFTSNGIKYGYFIGQGKNNGIKVYRKFKNGHEITTSLFSNNLVKKVVDISETQRASSFSPNVRTTSIYDYLKDKSIEITRVNNRVWNGNMLAFVLAKRVVKTFQGTFNRTRRVVDVKKTVMNGKDTVNSQIQSSANKKYTVYLDKKFSAYL